MLPPFRSCKLASRGMRGSTARYTHLRTPAGRQLNQETARQGNLLRVFREVEAVSRQLQATAARPRMGLQLERGDE